VEDLHRLVERAAGETGAGGVSAGAILSDYQRVRVESVCSRLGLTSLAFLWRRDQVNPTQIHDILVRIRIRKSMPLNN
jgi:diphthine-ammonia ligase